MTNPLYRRLLLIAALVWMRVFSFCRILLVEFVILSWCDENETLHGGSCPLRGGEFFLSAPQRLALCRHVAATGYSSTTAQRHLFFGMPFQ